MAVKILYEGFESSLTYVIKSVDGKTFEWKPSKSYYNSQFMDEITKLFPEIKSFSQIETITEKDPDWLDKKTVNNSKVESNKRERQIIQQLADYIQYDIDDSQQDVFFDEYSQSNYCPSLSNFTDEDFLKMAKWFWDNDLIDEEEFM